MSTSIERQRAFKERMNKSGFVQCVVWVPPAAIAEFQLASELVRQDTKLTIGRLVDVTTGKLRGLKRAAAPLVPDDSIRTGRP
jgi:hypothetical protein